MKPEYQKLLQEWKTTLNAMEACGGHIWPLKIENPAAEHEIREIEKKLGFGLPPSFRDALLSFSKKLVFRWSFPKGTNEPHEFREIFSGGFQWSLSDIEDLSHSVEEEDEYLLELKDKLQFATAGNGDILAFDMSVKGEPPVVYWDHEESTITHIADSFLEYLEKMTNLHCVGLELWQYEAFLGEKGIEPECERAKHWRQWFRKFTETKLEDIEGNLKELVEWSIEHGDCERKAREAFLLHAESDILREVSLYYQDESRDRVFAACRIVGEVFGKSAREEALRLWNEDGFDERCKAYLLSQCLPENEGLQLVFEWLESTEDGKVQSFEALWRLCHFRSNKVIAWLEKHARFPVTNGWDELFACSEPTWNDIVRWVSLEERHRVTVIHALEGMVKPSPYEPYPKERKKIEGAPRREEAVLFLERLKETEILKKRIAVIDEIIEKIDDIL